MAHSKNTFLFPKYFFKKDFNYLFICLFLERGERRGKKGEKYQCVVASHTSPPLPGTWPTTQTCALTRNQTSNTLVCRPALSPLSHTSQGPKYFSSEINFILVCISPLKYFSDVKHCQYLHFLRLLHCSA